MCPFFTFSDAFWTAANLLGLYVTPFLWDPAEGVHVPLRFPCQVGSVGLVVKLIMDTYFNYLTCTGRYLAAYYCLVLDCSIQIVIFSTITVHVFRNVARNQKERQQQWREEFNRRFSDWKNSSGALSNP